VRRSLREEQEDVQRRHEKDHKTWRRRCYLPHRQILGRFGCARRGPVPSLEVGKGIEQEGEPPMRSQPDITGYGGSRNSWSSIAVRERWLLTARASSVVGGVRCE
jgi:hypothetical protein